MRVGRVLVRDQAATAVLDQRLQRTGAALGRSGREPPHPFRRVGAAPPPQKRLLVGVHSDPVDLDGPFQGLSAHRNEAPLPSKAQQKQVGGDGVAEQFGSGGGGVDEVAGRGAGLIANGLLHGLGVKIEVGIEHERGG